MTRRAAATAEFIVSVSFGRGSDRVISFSKRM
jgi:hypothetical protein